MRDRVLLLLLLLVLPACARPTESPARDDAGGARDVAVEPGPVDVVAGDLDGDGALDLVTANGRGLTLSIRLYRASGWTASPSSPLTVPVQPHLVALGDLDRDGDLDLVATAHDADGVFAWLGDGKGSFTPAAGSPFRAFDTEKPHNHGLAVGDLDGDGDADVVVADQDARAAAVLLADGGALRRTAASPIALGGQPYPLVLGDLNRDGALDVVVPLVGDRAISVLLGDGHGGFASAPGSPHPTSRDRPYSAALVDLDRDGALDVIAAHDDTDDVSLLLGDGAGRLRDAPGSPLGFGVRVWRIAIGDVDEDGIVDAVSAGSGRLVIALGDGRGGLAPPQALSIGEAWTAVVADLDGDGRPNIAAPLSDAGVVRIWPSFREWRAP